MRLHPPKAVLVKNLLRLPFFILITGSFLLSGCAYSELTTSGYGETGDQWIMPDSERDMPVWGIKKGIILGIYPTRMSFLDIDGGPRGLFRIGYESNGTLRFVNFMAVHPVFVGQKGELVSLGSELEKSPSDGREGIRFYPYPVDYLQNPQRYSNIPPSHMVAEIVREGDRQVLQWGVKTETFQNGMEVFLIFRINEHRFNEIQIESYVLKGRKNMKYLALSTTFGNITRLRNLYLNGETIHAGELYKGRYRNKFAPRKFFKIDKWPVDFAGDSLFIAGPDEIQPWKVKPYPHNQKLLQYFKIKSETKTASIRGLVNGREKYWKSIRTIPGGVAFENIAVVDDFHQGQKISLGIFRGSVEDLLSGRFERK